MPPIQTLPKQAYDFAITDEVIRFAIGTIMGTPQIVNSNYSIYREKSIELLPMVCWEQNLMAPFSSIFTPDASQYQAKENYGTIKLDNFYKIDRVQANIGSNINLTVQRVDGQIFFDYAQAMVSSYPAIYWWNNLELTLYLYPVPTACVLRVFGRRLICKKVDRDIDGALVVFPWLDPEIVQDYVFEYLGYSLAKALHIYYGLPWSEAKDNNLENLRSLLSEKQEQSFIRPHTGALLKKGRNKPSGSLFTLGKGPLIG